MSSTFLQLQSANVVAESVNRPRRVLRLEAGSGITFSVTASTNVMTAQIASDGAGALVCQSVALSSSTSFERRDGVVVAASFIFNAGDYTGSKVMKAVLASASGSTVRARMFDLQSSTYVDNALVSTASATPSIVQSAALTLAASQKLYEIHLDVTGAGEASDQGICSYCEIRSS